MFCANCGSKVESSFRFCPCCGKLLHDLPAIGEKPQKLSEDLVLSFRSISTNNGHFGSEIRYIHEKHVVAKSSWGCSENEPMKSFCEEMKIPASVSTKEELVKYIEKKNPNMAFEIRVSRS